MKVKFWGVRGSIPTPIAPEDVEEKLVHLLVAAGRHNIATPKAAREFLSAYPVFQRSTVGGNTPCVEVQAGGERLIIDAGSGIKNLGRRLVQEEFGKGEGRADILMSHTHWDHIVGFPFFVPAYIPGNRITFWGCHARLRQRFKNQHHPYNFPVPLETMPADIRFRKLTPEKKKRLGGFTVTPLLLVHPGDAYAYRIEHGGRALIYASDASYNDPTPENMQRYHDFYRNADALIFDAHFGLIESFEKSNWGHSTPFIGVDIALHAGAKRLLLFHHDHLSDDKRLQELYESTRRYCNHVAPDATCQLILAHEGLEIEL